MEISFKGKRALVTGASKGIGRGIAKNLAKYGAEVVAVGRNTADLESLKKECPSIETIILDVTDWEKTESVLSKVGHIDLLVNNAGEGLIKSLINVTEEDIDSRLDLNIKALMHVTQIIVRDMLKRKSPGSIVNLSSQASIAALKNQTVYCASKGAVDAFTRATALELGSYNIRVNSVNPTVIMTEMGRLWWHEPAVALPMMQKIPLQRFGEIQEVVNAVLYLLSDKSSMVTGTCLPIDGGFLAT